MSAALCGPASAAAEVPNLMTVVQQALNNNPGFHAAAAEYRAALEAGPLARGVMLPQLSAIGEYDRIKQAVEGDYFGIPDIDIEDTFDRKAYGMYLTQALYHRDQWIALDQADVAAAGARLKLAAAQDALQIFAAEAYFGLLAAQDSLVYARAEKDAIARQKLQSGDRFEAGLLSDADYKAVLAQYDQTVADELAAANAVEVARSQLELVTSELYQEVRPLSPSIRLPAPDPNRLETWIERAENHNNTLLAQRAAAQLAKLDADRLRAKHWPTLDIIGSRFQFDQSGGVSGAREDLDERIGVMLRVPIYSGGLTSALVRKAEETFNAASAMEQQRRAEAVQQTRASFLSMKTASLRIIALSQAVQSSIAAEEAARAGFEVGTQTSAEALAKVRDRFGAERDLALARYGYVVNLLKLKQAAGSLTRADLEKINSWLR